MKRIKAFFAETIDAKTAFLAFLWGASAMIALPLLLPQKPAIEMSTTSFPPFNPKADDAPNRFSLPKIVDPKSPLFRLPEVAIYPKLDAAQEPLFPPGTPEFYKQQKRLHVSAFDLAQRYYLYSGALYEMMRRHANQSLACQVRSGDRSQTAGIREGRLRSSLQLGHVATSGARREARTAMLGEASAGSRNRISLA